MVGAVSYSANPGPQSVDPSVGPLSGGTMHRIHGSGFVGPVSVSVGGQVAPGVVLVSSREVDFVLPPGEAAGLAAVTLTSGGTPTTVPGGITYVNGTAPSVSSFTPTSGPLEGGTTVDLTGSNFPTGAVVRFGGVQGTV